MVLESLFFLQGHQIFHYQLLHAIFVLSEEPGGMAVGVAQPNLEVHVVSQETKQLPRLGIREKLFPRRTGQRNGTSSKQVGCYYYFS